MFHTVTFWKEIGLNLSYFTVFSNVVLLVIFATLASVHLLLFLIEPNTYATWTQLLFSDTARYVPWTAEWVRRLQFASSNILLAGRSIATFLLLASISLIAIYDGGDLPKRDGIYPERRGTHAFLIWHFCPAIAWGLLASYSQCWAQHVQPTRARALAVWITSGSLNLLGYLVVLVVEGSGMPVEYPTEVPVLVVATLGAVIPPWIAYSV